MGGSWAVLDSPSDAQVAADRLRDGAERVQRLQRRGVPSDEAEWLRHDLFTYAWPTLQKMISSQQIFIEGRVRPTDEEWEVLRSSHDERLSLAVETMTAAIDSFLSTLLQGGWDPDRGAALATFFIGACKNHFQQAYARWAGWREAKIAALPAAVVLPQPRVEAMEDIVIERIDQTHLLQKIMRLATPEMQATCELTYIGYTTAEIATAMNISRGAVRQRFHRLRRTLKEAAERGDLDLPSNLLQRIHPKPPVPHGETDV